MSEAPVCEWGCVDWEDCEDPQNCAAANRDEDDEAHGERFGFGVCRTGRCIEPCGQHGGCARR